MYLRNSRRGRGRHGKSFLLETSQSGLRKDGDDDEEGRRHDGGEVVGGGKTLKGGGG